MATDKTILLITGGNTGLGLEVVKALSQSQNAYEIIIGCRTVSKGEQAIEELKKEFPQTASTYSTLQVDYESDESLEKAVAELSSRHGRLDVLINNGGANLDFDILQGKRTVRDAFNTSWNINVTGTHILTELAVPLLLKSSKPRLLFITSGTASIAETADYSTPAGARLNTPLPAGWPKSSQSFSATSYRSTKVGLNMLMREWRRILYNDGVKVWAISPGFLATGLGGFGVDKLKQMGALDPSVGGHFIKDVVEGKRDADEGKAIRKDSIQPW